MAESYWSAVVKNIIGFMPLGLSFQLLFSARGVRRPALLTLALGASVSVSIEVLQWLLPTRDSGMTDIFTNTLGTWCGILLQSYTPRWLIRDGFWSL
jgi:glycopeptide antibiotics resistance protein